MPGFDSARESHREAEHRLHSLHKGLGIRHPDLRKRLGSELRKIWRIADDDDLEIVRAKAIYRLETILRKFSDPQLSMVVRTYYNIYLDPPARDLPLGERL